VETASVLKEIERLRMATVGELQDRYLELFGQRSRSLQNPLGWADQKRWCLDPLTSRRKAGRDDRLPAPGSILRREFKGQLVLVQVLASGFQYQDRFYRSLSAIARQATGTQWNGYAFFHLQAGSDGESK
jgi:hypothetical protein